METIIQGKNKDMKTYLVRAGVVYHSSNPFNHPPLPYWEYRLVEAENENDAYSKFQCSGVPEIISELKKDKDFSKDHNVRVEPIVVLKTIR